MRQLFSTPDFILATDVHAALKNAGIDAEVTDERQGSYSITTMHVVWVAEDADQRAVEQIVRAVPGFEARRPRPTRVSASEELFWCAACKYDLRGQLDDGNCPECGRPYHIVRTVQCPNCRESIPDDFSVCWSCGAETTPPVA
jgi:hypothetical protein